MTPVESVFRRKVVQIARSFKSGASESRLAWQTKTVHHVADFADKIVILKTPISSLSTQGVIGEAMPFRTGKGPD